jgi:nitrate/nitrite transporter NarK
MSTGERFRRSDWTVVGLCWALYLFVGAYEVAPASVLPVIMERLAVGPTAASWVTSALFLSMAAAAIPVGMVLDGVDNRTGLVVGAVWLFVTALWGWYAGATGAYLSLVVSRFAGGIAVVAIWTASINVVGAVATRDHQATAITVFATSVPLGIALGQFATPLLAARLGWATSFLVYGALVLAFALVFRMGSRNVDTTTGVSARPTRTEFAEVFRQRAVWGVAVLGFIAISLMFIINNWMPTYFRDQYQLSLARSGLFAAVFPAIGLLSRGSSGLLSDRVFGRRRKPLVVLAFLVTAPAIAGIALAETVALTLALLVVAGFFSQLGQVLLFVYVRELVPSNVVGTALAVLNAVGFFGAFSAPILTGMLIERSGAYLLAFGYAGVISVAAVGIALLVPEPNR